MQVRKWHLVTAYTCDEEAPKAKIDNAKCSVVNSDQKECGKLVEDKSCHDLEILDSKAWLHHFILEKWYINRNSDGGKFYRKPEISQGRLFGGKFKWPLNRTIRALQPLWLHNVITIARNFERWFNCPVGRHHWMQLGCRQSICCYITLGRHIAHNGEASPPTISRRKKFYRISKLARFEKIIF